MVQSIGFGASLNITKFDILDIKKMEMPDHVQKGAENVAEILAKNTEDKRRFEFFQMGSNYHVISKYKYELGDPTIDSFNKSVNDKEFKTEKGTENWILEQINKEEIK